MSSETSLVAAKVRLREWAAQIQECQSRPAHVDITTWCREHGITKPTYYYRLRKVRESLLAQVSNAQDSLPFVEIPYEASVPASAANTAVAATLSVGEVSLQISNSASKEFLVNLIGAMKLC